MKSLEREEKRKATQTELGDAYTKKMYQQLLERSEQIELKNTEDTVIKETCSFILVTSLTS